MISQENMDIIKTKITKEAKFLQDGTYVDKKINIVETRTQIVDTKPSQPFCCCLFSYVHVEL